MENVDEMELLIKQGDLHSLAVSSAEVRLEPHQVAANVK